MPIPDPHTGITVMKAVGTYVTREEAEAVRAEMMKRPATPYQDSTLQDCFRMFKESREYKGRSDKACVEISPSAVALQNRRPLCARLPKHP